MKKKLFSLFIVAALVISMFCTLPSAAFAMGEMRVVIGADLNDEQIEDVYSIFGISRGSAMEMTVTNAEERTWLSGYVDEAVIGTRSISCVFVELLPEGSGTEVTTANISWCTPEMYIAALATAGITDVRVIVAAPFEVSGTAALTGVYKAYEDITGQKLDDISKLVSTQELTITGELAEEIGSMDSTSIVNELKLVLDETQNMTDDEIRDVIYQIAGEYNVKLTDTHVEQLISLCRSMEGLDTESLTSRVQDIQNTLKKVSDAKTKVVGFVEKAKKVISAISEFVDKIKEIFG